MPNKDDKFVKELVQTSEQTQGNQTTESQIQERASHSAPWWSYILAGAGVFAAGKIGGGLLRSIDLLAGEAAVAKAGMSAAQAVEKYGTITAKDITSTIFGRLSFTAGMIGKPNVFLSNKLFEKVPGLYGMLFNTTTAGSVVANMIRSIPGVQTAMAKATDRIVLLKDKILTPNKPLTYMSEAIKSRIAGINSIDTTSVFAKNAMRGSDKLFENENYLVPQIIKQLVQVTNVVRGADEATAAEIKQSVNEFIQRQTASLQAKAKTLSFFGLKPVSYAAHAEKFGKEIPKSVQTMYSFVKQTLGDVVPSWDDLMQLPASPDLFATQSGKLTRVYSPGKIAVDATRKLLQNVNIPYLGFNPLTLLQPGFVEEMMNQRFVTELGGRNFVPYKSGMTTVADLARAMSLKDKNAKMYIIGGKAFLHSSGKTVPVKELGEVYALKSHNVSSAINRIYAFETGMYRGGVQKADVPFNQKNNIEGSLYEELKTAYKRIAKAKLKRWQSALTGKDTLEMLSTMAEMHNVNMHTAAWKMLAEEKGIYDLPIKEQVKMFTKYATSTSKAALQISKMSDELTSAQRHNLYAFFAPTTKEQKLYDLLVSKGEEALTARYLNQGVTAGLKYKDVLATGALKYKLYSTKNSELKDYIYSVAKMYGQSGADVDRGGMAYLHVYTEALKTKIIGRSDVREWVKDFSDALASESINKVKKVPYGTGMLEALQLHALSAKEIYKTATGMTPLERLFTNIEHSTKNVTRLTAKDYLIIGKYRTPWETKAQGGTLKDWLLQMSPTPSTFSKRSSVPGLMLHWLVERPYDLLEYTGLGRPNYSTTYNAASTVGSLFLRRILPLAVGIGAVGYTNYLVDKYTGVDVKKDSLEYAKRVGIGALRLGEITGVVPAVQYIHKHYPGLISTGAFLYGQYTSNVRTAMLFGSLASFAENVPSARKTALAWYGVNQVPVRAGRWWELGSDPFQGGRVKYYRPSLAYLATSNWQYTSTLWGSKENYWKYGSMLPTPTNLFGILPLVGKDKFLRTMHQKDRPYGFVGTGVMNTPAEQKLRQSTGIGAIYGGVNAIASYKKSRSISTQTIKQMQHNAAVMRANSLKAAMSYVGKYLEEYPGMPGFLGGAFLSKITNEPRQMYIASPSYMASSYRQYYQKELGSVFGMSELLRRLIPNQHPWYNTITGNIRNTQPSWLPQRFQYGDPYAQLEFGEVRLPGAAYLATHPLANGEYTPAQQMEIVANTSPRSSSYDKIMEEIKKAPPQTAGERYTMYMAAKEHQAILTGNAAPFSPYSMKLTTTKIQLGKYLGEGVFENPNNPRAVITFAGAQASVDAIAAHLFQTQNITLSQAYAKAQQQIKEIDKKMQELSGQTITAVVPADEGARYRMLMSGALVEEVYNKGATKELLKLGAMPVDNTTMSYYATHKAPFAKEWEKFRHLDSFFVQKFGGGEDALEYYKRHLYSGALFQNWSSPISSFVLPALLKPTGEGFFSNMTGAFYTGMFGAANPIEAAPAVAMFGLLSGFSSFLPSIPTPENKKRIELENKYMLAEYYLGKNNLFGNQLPSLKDIEKELPQPESEYFAQFLNAPTSARAEIARIVPDAERYLLQEYWHLKDMDASGNLEAASIQPIANTVPEEASAQILQQVNTQAQNLNLMMARSSYTDKISLALNAMHDQSMIRPVYTSAGIDLVHKQKRGAEMAHYYGANNVTVGYSGNNSLNVRRNYGR